MITCLQCRHDNQVAAKFCNECGERFDYARYARRCAECGHRNAVMAACCLDCGGPLDTGSTIEPRVPLGASHAGEPEEARFHRAVARGFLARGETELAIKQLQEAERHDPDNFHTLVELGIAQQRGGDSVAAHRALETAVKACEDKVVLIALGRKLLDLHEPAVARAAFQKAGGSEGLAGMGRASLVLGEHAVAKGYFEEASEAAPASFEVVFGLAVANLELGKTEVARDLLRRATEFKIKSPSAFQDLLDRLIVAGEGDLALRKVRLSLDKYRNNAGLHRHFGDVLMHFGDKDGAREQYLEASDISYSDSHIDDNTGALVAFHRELATRFAAVGAITEAAEEIKLAHGERDDTFGYCFDMAGLLAALDGKEKEGIRYLKRALTYPAAEEPVWRYRLAILFDKLGDPLRAAAELDEAAGLLQPDYCFEEDGQIKTTADLRLDFAQAYYKLGIAERGRNELKEAVRATITHAEGLLRVARACCDLKEDAIAEALLDLARPLAREAGDPALLDRLETMYARSGAGV